MYWTSNDSGFTHLYRGEMDNLDHPTQVLPPVARVKRQTGRPCVCGQHGIESVFAMDHANTKGSMLYFVDAQEKSIWLTDMSGCRCKRVVHNQPAVDQGTNVLQNIVKKRNLDLFKTVFTQF